MAGVLQEASEPALSAMLAAAGGYLGIRFVPKETVEALVTDQRSWSDPEKMERYLCYDPDSPERCGRWTAVDNSDGDAYTEEFKDPAIAIGWLRDEMEADEAHRRDGTQG